MINDVLLPVAELWEAEGKGTFAYTFNDPTLFKGSDCLWSPP